MMKANETQNQNGNQNTNNTTMRGEKTMMYEVIKMNSKTNECKPYGAGYTAEEVKQIATGYKFDCELNPAVNDGRTGEVYTRKSCSWYFIAYEMKEETPEETTTAAAAAADPQPEEATEAAADPQPEEIPETITRTKTGKKASREDLQAAGKQALDKLSALRMNAADNAERIHELQQAIRDLDRDIMQAYGDHLRREGKKELKAAKAAKKAQKAATLQSLPEEAQRTVEEMEQTREVLLAELAELTRKQSNREAFETGADWIEANAALKTVAKGVDREELTRRVFAPILAMLYRITCRHQYREDWDVYEITANGKMMPTQRYNDYKMQIYTELYSLCIDRPNDSFKDLLFLATKRGVYAVWTQNGNHRISSIDPETGKRVWRKVTVEDVAQVIEYAAGDGSENQHDDGENATNSPMIDAYANTAAIAINNAIVDEICRDRKPQELEILRDMAFGIADHSGNGKEAAETKAAPKDVAYRVRKSRLIKKIRSEYPEYIIKEEQPQQRPERIIRLPYIRGKYYIHTGKECRWTCTETFTGYPDQNGEQQTIRHYAPYYVTYQKAGEQPETAPKAYKISHHAEVMKEYAMHECDKLYQQQEDKKAEQEAKQRRRALINKAKRTTTRRIQWAQPIPEQETRKPGNNAGMMKATLADLKRKQLRRERLERQAAAEIQRRHKALEKAEQAAAAEQTAAAAAAATA